MNEEYELKFVLHTAEMIDYPLDLVGEVIAALLELNGFILLKDFPIPVLVETNHAEGTHTYTQEIPTHLVRYPTVH